MEGVGAPERLPCSWRRLAPSWGVDSIKKEPRGRHVDFPLLPVEGRPSQGLLVQGNGPQLIKIAFPPGPESFPHRECRRQVRMRVCQAFGGVLESPFFENLVPHPM